MNRLHALLPVALAGLGALGGGLVEAGEARPAASVDAYNVLWDSPSADEHGSMPLGNGDVGLNVWLEPTGELVFYVSKTDAWDDNARLVKVGKVRVRFDPNCLAARPFRQTLSLRDATVRIEAGQGDRRSSLQVWVEADRPVVHVQAETARPIRATACIELWRTERREYTDLQCSDIMTGAPAERRQPTLIEPDTLLTARRGRIGWYHRNVKSFGPRILSDIQGLGRFPQADPLLGRTFGAVLVAEGGKPADDLHLLSPAGTSHHFEVHVLTKHPAAPEQWLAEMDRVIAEAEAQPDAIRRAAHEKWWADFWGRSWIRAAGRAEGAESGEAVVPANGHALRVGSDQHGGNRFAGEMGRVGVYARALEERELRALAGLDRRQSPASKEGLLLWSPAAGPVAKSEAWDFTAGLTIEAWVKPDRMPGGGRIVDKITPGGSDGFLLDTFPGNSVRFICGREMLAARDAAPAGRWTHVAAVADPKTGACRLYVDGKPVGGADAGLGPLADEAAFVSRMYHLQRFVNACAGRGAHPIKFNGSIFTVAPAGKDGDFRRWGPGYWWQNTRLPYISMPASGDFDLMRPLFEMYAGEVLQLSKYRTKLYCGHDGAFLPECIYFWGPIFSETYGWTPASSRSDKLQASRWHKWEWVGGLELCWMMLDCYEHTLDEPFLARTAIPFIHEILTFFDQHYRSDQAGRMVMHPGQACETWWECTNPMPEVAGCIAVTERLLALPTEGTPAADRALWRRLHDKLPPLPTRQVEGRTALAPAEKFDMKRNSENPELYAVFPFRLVAVGRPHLDWGVEALRRRLDRGHSGWRQDDIFMAYLGLAGEARRSVVARARSHDRNERFDAFWGPNYDWTPDQDHGGVLMKAFQAMLLQTDGRTIHLLPAWPAGWQADFRLHAPLRTVVEGKVRGGKLVDLEVIPPARRKDVVMGGSN